MSDTHSTAPVDPGKPAKPYPEFPLKPHTAGQWLKKIGGKLHYFGPWADSDRALNNYLEQKDAPHAGRMPWPDPEAATVKVVVNSFLISKRDRMQAGELSVRTWAKYKEVTDLLVSLLGKLRLAADLGPDDFAARNMSSVDRETISDTRLKAVTDHVRAWLFPPEKTPAGVAAAETPSVG
jgi:hypothetical protein